MIPRLLRRERIAPGVGGREPAAAGQQAPHAAVEPRKQRELGGPAEALADRDAAAARPD
jgi:hypothetical protein